MMKNTAMTEASIEREVDRYVLEMVERIILLAQFFDFEQRLKPIKIVQTSQKLDFKPRLKPQK